MIVPDSKNESLTEKVSKTKAKILEALCVFFPKEIAFMIIDYTEIAFQGQFVRRWGTQGSKPGEMDFPSGLATDGKFLYVSDQKNHRVQVMALNGEFISQFGKHGTKDGEFQNPYYLTVLDQTIYVTDFYNSRVQAFRIPTGTYVRKWNVNGHCGGVAIFDSELFIPIWDTGLEIYSFLTGKLIRSWKDKTDAKVFLNGIVVDEESLYLVDYENHCVKVFSKNGTFLSRFGKQGRGENQFYYPSGILGMQDSIFVSDNFYVRKLQKKDGKVLQRWGGEANENHHLYGARGMVIVDELFYVADMGHHCIKVFN